MSGVKNMFEWLWYISGSHWLSYVQNFREGAIIVKSWNLLISATWGAGVECSSPASLLNSVLLICKSSWFKSVLCQNHLLSETNVLFISSSPLLLFWIWIKPAGALRLNHSVGSTGIFIPSVFGSLWYLDDLLSIYSKVHICIVF